MYIYMAQGSGQLPPPPSHAYTRPTVNRGGKVEGCPLWVVVVGWVLAQSTAEGLGKPCVDACIYACAYVCMHAFMHAKTIH